MASRTVEILTCDDCGKELSTGPPPKPDHYIRWRLSVPRMIGPAVSTGLDLCIDCHDERLLHTFSVVPLRAKCFTCGGVGTTQESMGGPSPDYRSVTCDRCLGRGVPPLSGWKPPKEPHHG